MLLYRALLGMHQDVREIAPRAARRVADLHCEMIDDAAELIRLHPHPLEQMAELVDVDAFQQRLWGMFGVPDIVRVMDLQQEQLARSMGEGLRRRWAVRRRRMAQ